MKTNKIPQDENITKSGQMAKAVVALLALSLMCLSPAAFGQVTVNVANPFSRTFGSGGDGLGGFNQSTIDVADTDTTWSTQATNIQFENTGAVTAGTQNHSFLQDFTYTAADGYAYSVTGSLQLTTYADDNNRIGMYLFGGESDLGVGSGEAEAGAIGLIYNTDQNKISIFQGIDNGELATVNLSGTTPFTTGTASATDNMTDHALDFATTFTYTGTNIDISFSMTYLNDLSSPVTDTVNFTVDAATYTGDYFGFVGRARNRGVVGRDSPYIVNYDDFSFTQTAVPEPSVVSLLLGGLASLVFVRRRRKP